VADETDFLDLYTRLRLKPGCSLAEFKQAYRRHVAQWHPDRRADGHVDALAARRLQRLTRQYGAAMEFHRRHGRLPGGAPLPGVAVATPKPAAVIEDGTPAATVIADTESLPRRPLGAWWWLAIGAIGVAVLAWSLMPAASEPDAEDSTEAAIVRTTGVPAANSAFAVSGPLSLGMSEDEVIALEGEPTQRADGRWEYGPSWVRFDNHTVSDWYSSPLRGLHSESPRPRH